MLLHDLDIIVDTQHSRGALAQLCQYIDAHGHIGALEHRNLSLIHISKTICSELTRYVGQR